MKKKETAIIIGFIGIIILITGWLLYNSKFEDYTLLVIVLGIIILLSDIVFLMNNKDEESVYSSSLKNILKNYESILVKTQDIPPLKGKNIIMLPDIEELVNASRETKKHIYYFREEDNTSFYLTLEDEILIYIDKLNKEVLSGTEKLLNQIEQEEKEESKDTSILEDIEKTTIIRINKLNEYKAFKVSPIRDEKEIEKKENPVEKEEIVKQEKSIEKEEDNVEPIKKEKTDKEEIEIPKLKKTNN